MENSTAPGPATLLESLDVGEMQDEAFYSADTSPEDCRDDEEDEEVDVEDVEEDVPSSSRFPSAEDEAPLMLKLSGRNEVDYVKVDGWTASIPLEYPGIRPDLTVKVGTVPEGKTAKDVLAEVRRTGLSLQEVSANQQTQFDPLRVIVVAQIVAKRSSNVFFFAPKDSGPAASASALQPSPSFNVAALGNAIIADSTGAALVTCWNEATSLFLDRVEVGDFVVIRKATSKQIDGRALKYSHPFRSQMLNLEIKVDKYDVRGIEVYPRDLFGPAPRFPLNLFDVPNVVVVPRNISHTNGVLKIEEETLGWLPEWGQRPRTHEPRVFTLMGVISYVGRVDRAFLRSHRAECLKADNTTKKAKEVSQFCASQWVELVDLTSTPLLVKLFVGRSTQNQIGKLVPGSHVVLTHCQLSGGVTDYVTATEYTEIYVNEGCGKYFGVLPSTEFQRFASSYFKATYLKAIYKRQDLKFRVGGTHLSRITRPANLLDFYRNHSDEERKVPEGKVFARRERFDFVAKVRIVAAYKMTKESCEIHLPFPSIHYKELFYIEKFYRSGYKQFVDSSCCCCSKCHRIHWHSRQRKLPPVEMPETPLLSVMKVLKAAIERYSEAIAPYALPATYKPVPKCALTRLPKASKYPAVSDESSFFVYLVDDVHKVKYFATWRGGVFSYDEMKRRLLEAKKEEFDALALIHIFSCESEEQNGLEVILHDFLPLKGEEANSAVPVPSA